MFKSTTLFQQIIMRKVFILTITTTLSLTITNLCNASENTPKSPPVGYKDLILGNPPPGPKNLVQLNCKNNEISKAAPSKSAEKRITELEKQLITLQLKMKGDTICSLKGEHTIATNRVFYLEAFYFKNKLEKFTLLVGGPKSKLTGDEARAEYIRNINITTDSFDEKYGGHKNFAYATGPSPITKRSPRNTIHEWSTNNAKISMDFYPENPRTLKITFESNNYYNESNQRSNIDDETAKELAKILRENIKKENTKRSNDM
jgi:hypothetical protein